MESPEGLRTNQRNLLQHIQSVGVPSILPTDRRTLQPIDMLALDGSEVFVVSLPGETLETHIEIL